MACSSDRHSGRLAKENGQAKGSVPQRPLRARWRMQDTARQLDVDGARIHIVARRQQVTDVIEDAVVRRAVVPRSAVAVLEAGAIAAPMRCMMRSRLPSGGARAVAAAAALAHSSVLGT